MLQNDSNFFKKIDTDDTNQLFDNFDTPNLS